MHSDQHVVVEGDTQGILYLREMINEHVISCFAMPLYREVDLRISLPNISRGTREVRKVVFLNSYKRLC